MTKSDEKKIVDYCMDHGGDSIENAYMMHMALFKGVPFMHKLDMTDATCRKYFEKLVKEFDMEIITTIFDSEKFNKAVPDFQMAVSKKHKIVVRHDDYRDFHIAYSKETPDKVMNRCMELTRGMFKTPPKKRPRGRIYVLALKGSGMRASIKFAPFKLDKFTLNVDKNYNDDFSPVSKVIKERLNEKDGNGIVILHGEAGTGKTYYLKHLCKTLSKRVLYIPPAMVQYIVSPQFIQMLGRHKNSILVIEDADNVLRKRDDASDVQDVSSILNLADGMLHDVLKLQIVCTFNTKLTNIDDAFLRKGRLIAEYEMKKLTKKKAQELSDHLGFKSKITKEMPLTDVYNQDSPLLKQADKKKLGFQTRRNED